MAFLGESESELNEQFRSAIRRLHALGVAINDAKAQYEATRNPAWLVTVRAYRDEFNRQMLAAKLISAKLTDVEMPSDIMLTLDRTSDWLVVQGRNVVEGTTGIVKSLGNPLVLIVVAAATFAVFSGKFGGRK